MKTEKRTWQVFVGGRAVGLILATNDYAWDLEACGYVRLVDWHTKQKPRSR